MNITNLHDLSEYAKGQIVELPPFAENQPFVARLCRPSMLSLAKSGKIPNELLSTANNLFVDGKLDTKSDPEALKNVFDLFDVICEACFVEPTYKDIQDAGITLTDEQYMFIFEYSQAGVKALKPFR
nr:MAG TPA: hypothetical protein [Caudoviricetes sp.]